MKPLLILVEVGQFRPKHEMYYCYVPWLFWQFWVKNNVFAFLKNKLLKALTKMWTLFLRFIGLVGNSQRRAFHLSHFISLLPLFCPKKRPVLNIKCSQSLFEPFNQVFWRRFGLAFQNQNALRSRAANQEPMKIYWPTTAKLTLVSPLLITLKHDLSDFKSLPQWLKWSSNKYGNVPWSGARWTLSTRLGEEHRTKWGV